MTALVFVDANVFLYSRDPSDRAKQARAKEWLASLWREGRGRTSMQVLSEVYVNLQRKLATRVPPEAAWDDVAALFAWRPLQIDETLMKRGREIQRRWRLSWWDSLVVAAAQLQDCAVLLTEDLQDGLVLGDVTVRSPFTLSVNEPSAAYVARPAADSRHRPRGRPRTRAAAD